MAVVLENSNKVWQKVRMALDSVGGGAAARTMFKELKAFLATQGGNPELQFIPFSAEQAVTAAGVDLTAAPCKVFGVYAKGRRTTGTTSSFLDFHAAATDAATTTTILDFRFKAVGQQVIWANPSGLASETGLTVHAATAVGGTVDSVAADAADGFVIIGAA